MELSVERTHRHWWVILIRGLLFIFLGIYMIASPAGSFAALGFLFGLIILLAGCVELLHATRDSAVSSRRWHLMLGIIDVVLGIVLMGHITASVTILRIIVGIWFLFMGVSLFNFAQHAGRSLALTIGAVLIVIFALFILFNPTFGDMTIILWIAIAFIITGVFNVWLGFRLK